MTIVGNKMHIALLCLPQILQHKKEQQLQDKKQKTCNLENYPSSNQFKLKIKLWELSSYYLVKLFCV